MVFFCIFFMLCFFLDIWILDPCLKNNDTTYILLGIYLFLWIGTLITFLCSACKNPQYIEQEDDEDLQILNLFRRIHPDDICPRCEVMTTPRSFHCFLCDKCVEGYDHHCPWLNNCIGANNRNSFLCFLLFFMLFNLTAFTIAVMLSVEFILQNVETDQMIGYYLFQNWTKKICVHEDLFLSIAIAKGLIILFIFIEVSIVMVESFKKFSQDGAQIISGEGNQISHDDRTVKNRVSKTMLLIH